MSHTTIKTASDLTSDLENWMGNLPSELRLIPIIHLAIPGSHDTMTYSIAGSSKVAPDAESIFQKFRWLGPLLTRMMARWSVTQNANITEQLKLGIRYLDLRVATRYKNDIYFVHGLYAENVRGPLEEIKIFLETHPTEVVILDCQHFYAFDQNDHNNFMLLITSTFGHKLLPNVCHMDHLSLDYLTTQFRYQVICIYRSSASRFGQPLLWPSKCWPTPWPDTDSLRTLLRNLDDNLKVKNSSRGYVTQCILTPQKALVLKNMCGSLKNSCVIPTEAAMHDWIKKQTPGEHGVNIIISDFIHLSDFCKLVIGLNAKLLTEST